MYNDCGHQFKTEIWLEKGEGMPAKVLQINFRLRVSTPEYLNFCRSFAQAFAEVPGLCWKIWLLNAREKTAGGIYLFENDQALTEFLLGPLALEMESHPAVCDLSARFFDVVEDVTAVTRGPVRTLQVLAYKSHRLSPVEES